MSCAILALSCSDPGADYEKIEDLLNAKSESYRKNPDYDHRFKCCDEVIGTLQAFLKKHDEGIWADDARKALAVWDLRKSALRREYDALNELLSARLKRKAMDEATIRDPTSQIDEAVLEQRTTSKEGLTIHVNETYSVTMRNLLHRRVFTMRVHTSGHIGAESKTTAVEDSVSVEH